jgi:hypothetical protein
LSKSSPDPEQPSHRLFRDGLRCSLEPIERCFCLIVARSEIGAVLEQRDPPVLAPARAPPFFKSRALRRRLGELAAPPPHAKMFDGWPTHSSARVPAFARDPPPRRRSPDRRPSPRSPSTVVTATSTTNGILPSLATGPLVLLIFPQFGERRSAESGSASPPAASGSHLARV